MRVWRRRSSRCRHRRPAAAATAAASGFLRMWCHYAAFQQAFVPCRIHLPVQLPACRRSAGRRPAGRAGGSSLRSGCTPGEPCAGLGRGGGLGTVIRTCAAVLMHVPALSVVRAAGRSRQGAYHMWVWRPRQLHAAAPPAVLAWHEGGRSQADEQGPPHTVCMPMPTAHPCFPALPCPAPLAFCARSLRCTSGTGAFGADRCDGGVFL